MISFAKFFLIFFLSTNLHSSELNKIEKFSTKEKYNFSLSDLTGEKKSLEDFRNKVIVLNFWASWCAPCVEEMPSLFKLKKNLSDLPFEVITVNFGENKKIVRDFFSQFENNSFVLIDEDQSTESFWVKKGLPTSYIIDSKGKIRYIILGKIEWNSKNVHELISNLF